jgi:hypothetical protein
MTLAPSYDQYASPQPLEDELAEVLDALKLRGRQARAVAARLGWNGEPPRTLAAAAAPEGYSRERVRQLEARVRRQTPGPAGAGRFTATKAALRLIEDATPIAPPDAARYLWAAGVSRRPFDVAGLLSAANILGVEHSLEEQDGLLRVRGPATLGRLTLGGAAA